MRKNITNFVDMAQDKTATYQLAKNVFTTLGLKDDVFLDINQGDVKIFRKHLSEMIKRQQSPNKYATRLMNNRVKVIRIQ